MSDPASEHRAQARSARRVAVVTVSDTRRLETDTGGSRIVQWLQQAGHRVVARQIVVDQAEAIREAIRTIVDSGEADAVLLTGGTGVGSRDVTFETVSALLTRTLPGYGELFRYLSYQQVGAAAMLSRTVGGLVGQIVVLTMPGSPKAVDLAMQELILPELAHLVDQARR